MNLEWISVAGEMSQVMERAENGLRKCLDAQSLGETRKRKKPLWWCI